MQLQQVEEKLYNLIIQKIKANYPEKSLKDITPAVRGAIVRNVWTEEIKNTRNAIVSVAKRLSQKDFLPGTSGNISARIGENALLITPSGLDKGTMSPEDLLLVDLDGNKLDSSAGKPSSETKMHLLAYKKRKDVGAIVHTHAPYCTAFASSRTPLDMAVLPEAVVILGEIQLVKYGTPSTHEVPDMLEPHIRGNNAFLLSNHGAMTFGRNLKEASHRMDTLEFNARVILLARLLGGEKLLQSDEVYKLKQVFGIL